MNFKFLSAASALGFLCSCADVAPPAAVYPIPTEAQIKWQKLETYAFIHYGLCTYNDSEWGFGDADPKIFNPSGLDVNQWVSTLKEAGMKGVLFTIKHHDGFGLWPSEHGSYNISQAPVQDGKGDLLRDVIEACKRNDMKIGLYISPWDRNHAQYGEKEYADYFQNQISEVLEKYCTDIDLFEFWFDGANGGDGYYGGAGGIRNIDPSTYYRYEEAAEKIHSKFPEAMIFGGTVPSIRWIGNESGWAGETNWSMYQDELKRRHANAMWGDRDGAQWMPGEVDVSVRPGWFYHDRESHQLRSIGTLVDYYYQSVGRNANLLLNVPIDKAGRIATADSARITQWKKVIDSHFSQDLAQQAKVTASTTRGRGFAASNVNDNDWDSYWAAPDGELTGTLTLDFKSPVEVNTLLLQEYIPLGQRIARFNVEYRNDNGEFVPVATTDSMTTIGYKRLVRFDNAKTDQIRIAFEESRGVPCINTVSAYLAPAVLDEPAIWRTADGKVHLKAANGTRIHYTTDGSEPTANSAQYEAPFDLTRKGTVKAIAFDPTSKELSAQKIEEFDILTSSFSIISPVADKDNKHAFDGSLNTSYYLPENVKTLTFSLGDTHVVSGLKYTPDQARWGGGPVYKYKVWVGSKAVAEGEFSNIKQNPIRQTIHFEPTKGSTVRIDVLGIGDNSTRASFSELSVLTES